MDRRVIVLGRLLSCGQSKVRKVQFLLERMESVVSNHAVASQSEQTLAAHGEYFLAERG